MMVVEPKTAQPVESNEETVESDEELVDLLS